MPRSQPFGDRIPPKAGGMSRSRKAAKGSSLVASPAGFEPLRTPGSESNAGLLSSLVSQVIPEGYVIRMALVA